MDYKYCSRCKKVYSGVGGSKLCGNCLRTLDEFMRKIRDYLDEHRGANISELSEGTEIAERDILYLLRNERLELLSNDGGFVCDICKEPIKSGRYCDKCKSNMGNSFANAASGMAARRNPGMSEGRYGNTNRADAGFSQAAKGKKMQVLDKYKNK